MKPIHSAAGAAVLALFLSSPLLIVRADQDEHPDPQKMHDRMDKMESKRLDAMTKKLNLTPAQQTTIKAALDDQKSKMEAFRKESGEKWKSVHEDTDRKITAVLTDDQKKQYDAMKAEMKEKMKEHMKDRKEHHDGPKDDNDATPPPADK